MRRYKVTLTAEGPALPNGRWEGRITVDAKNIGQVTESKQFHRLEDEAPGLEGASPTDIHHISLTVTDTGPAARRVPRKRAA